MNSNIRKPENDRSITLVISARLSHRILATGKVTTASEKFELGFAKAYSKISDVKIIYIGTDEGPDEDDLDGVSIVHVGRRSLLGKILPIVTNKNCVVFSTGYDPARILPLLLLKWMGHQSYSFIYDNHILSIAHLPPLKRLLVDLYNRAGFCLALHLSGWIVLNDRFIKSGQIGVPYLKVPVGVDERPAPASGVRAPDQSGRSVVLFAGEINEANGADLLLDSLAIMADEDVQLHFYGSGPLEHKVKAAAQLDTRIKFFGRVDNDVIAQRQKSATCLVHLRNPYSASCEFSFPSKLVEYLMSGRPVLSNIFPGLGDFAEFIVPIDAFDSPSIARALKGVLSGQTAAPDWSQKLHRFTNKTSWSKIVSDIDSFARGSRTEESPARHRSEGETAAEPD